MPRHANQAPVEPDDEDAFEYDGPSKSQLKRESTALQQLGVALIALSRGQLAKLDIPDALRTAVQDAQRITANSAIKRQRQYIGRLMRDIDPAPIQAYLDALQGDNDRQTDWLHLIEHTRDQLMLDDSAFARLVAEHPGIDIQTLRQQVRNARAERAAGKPPKHYRALFQSLKDIYPQPALARGEDEEDGEEDTQDDED